VAISSSLNPATIARERPTTATAAQNFITGGAPLGEGVIASAANKIVGFQRGAAGVAARPPDLNGIIQTLSTNILNNVENRVQSVNQNVTQVVNRAIGGLEKDYKERLDKIDAAKPNSILQNFLNLYQKALGYIQFLGNRKNVKTLGENLKSLQNIFTETFNVAKIIRQVIVKIVKQLSSLPTATGGGGGLNLDIDIPGGSLRKGPMGGISRMMRRRPGLMLGGAALAGGLGSQVVSGMMDLGGDVQAAPMAEGTIPTSLLDRFNGVLDRFSAAINSLSKVKRTQSSSGGKGTTTPPTKEKIPGTSPGGAVPTSPSGSADFSGSANAEKSFNYFVSQGYTKEQSAGLVGNLMQENRALDPNVANSIGHKGIAQWDPKIRYPQLAAFAKSKGLDPNTLETQLQFVEQELRTGSGGLSKSNLQSTKTVEQAALLVRKQYLRPGEAEAMDANRIQFGQQVLQKYGGNAKPGVTGKPGEKGTPGKPGVDGKPGQLSTVVAAPNQSQAQQQVAQAVSQPPTQQKPQVTVAPMNMASPQTQSTGQGGKSIPPPQMSVGGVSVPFFSSSNTDNFLTLYSKIVYNIVDG
jgi:hypothetical protein